MRCYNKNNLIERGIIMEDKKKTVHDFNFIGRLIEVLKILREETDEFHTISQAEILEQLKSRERDSEEKLTCSERTLTDYLKTAMQVLNPEEKDGYVSEDKTIEDYVIIAKGLEDKLRARDIGLKKEGAKKLQLRELRYNHPLSFDELNYAIEGVLFLRYLDDEKKKKIISKLAGFSSKNFLKYSPYISEYTGAVYGKIGGVFEDSRIDEVALRDNISLIRRAMEENQGAGVKIAFHFNGYDENKKMKIRTDTKGNTIRYVANPYYIIMYNGKPYLICAIDPHETVSIFRIDLMSNIATEIKPSISEPRKPKSKIKGLPVDWNSKVASQFQTEHLYMYYGEPERIILKIHRERYTLLHDYFGDRYTFLEHLDDTWDRVKVKCVPDAMIAWAMQCSDFIEVLEPESIRKKILEKCIALTERYR